MSDRFDSLRILGLLDEAKEQLLILGTLALDIPLLDPQRADQVGEENLRIIEEQRRLETQYEQLVSQRATLRIQPNKSQYKDNEREIQQLSQLLRESTKRLCRNRKDTSSESGHSNHVQQERQRLITIMSQLLEELDSHGTFATMSKYIAKIKRTQITTSDIAKKEKDLMDQIRKLATKVESERFEFQQKEAMEKKRILDLKEHFIVVKGKNKTDTQYARKEMEAKKRNLARMYHQIREEEALRLAQFQDKCDVEERIHLEMTNFLRTRQDQLQADVITKQAIHAKEADKKQIDLQNILQENKSLKEQLACFEKRWQADAEEMANEQLREDRRVQEAIARQKDLQMRDGAVRKIQDAIRLFRENKKAQKAIEATKKRKKKSKK